MFHIAESINQGISSRVFKCINTDTNEVLAAKVYRKGEEYFSCFKNELQWLSSFDHPAIIQCKGNSTENGYNVLYMEKCKHDLFDEIQVNGALSIDDVRSRLKPLFEAISLIHSNDAAHCDIKLENIGVMDNGYLKLIDFGSCSSISQRSITNAGTLYYFSPESYSYRKDQQKGDIWALGVTLFAAATGMFPFEGDEEEYIDGVVNMEPRFDLVESIDGSESLLSLLKGMLSKQPNNRFTISECLRHSFFM